MVIEQWEDAYHPDKYVMNIFVHPEHEQKGMGKLLYNYMEELLLPRNPVKITSEVWEYIKLKIEDEKKYKDSINKKIDRSINDIHDLNQKAEYLSSLADEAIFLGNKIGIGPIFLKDELKKLIETSKQYNKCIDKII